MPNAWIFFHTVTILGDSGFVLPASGALLATLWTAGNRRTALAFAAAAAFCVSATIAAKLGFMACGGAAAIHSPSGHASLATMFFASLGFVAATAKDGAYGRLVAAACLGLAVLIAASRVVTGAHTIAETLFGLAIGIVSFGVLWRFAAPKTRLHLRWPALVLGSLLVLYVALGRRVHVEGPLERLAEWLGRQIGC